MIAATAMVTVLAVTGIAAAGIAGVVISTSVAVVAAAGVGISTSVAAITAAGIADVQINHLRVGAAAPARGAGIAAAAVTGSGRTGTGIIRKTASGAAQAVQRADARAPCAGAIAGRTICHLTGLLSLGFGAYYSAAKERVSMKNAGPAGSEKVENLWVFKSLCDCRGKSWILARRLYGCQGRR